MFGSRSERELKTTHPDLVKVHRLAITKFDYMIIQSTRTKEEQELDYLKGTSRAHWLQSPHDYPLALATDCAPLPLDWSNTTSFYTMAQVILNAARTLNIAVTWGGDFPPGTIKDRPHFQLTNWKAIAFHNTQKEANK